VATAGNRPQQVTFKLGPNLAAAVAAMRRLPGVDFREDQQIYNFLIHRGLKAWLADNREPERPWEEIAGWFEANPEASEVTDEGMNPDEMLAWAIQRVGYCTDTTDDGGDTFTVWRDELEERLAAERTEIEAVLAAHRTINTLLNQGWRYRAMATEEAAQ
jgi:hypothetical protein